MKEPGMLVRVEAVEGNTQRLDGGAMFGNAPRPMWSRWIAPDERNRIPLACRALLVTERSGRRILFESGVGAFFAPSLRDRYGVVEEAHVLLEGLAARGVRAEDIDVVVLSHLHFDHVGGLVTAFDEGEPLRWVFKHARVVVSDAAWARAQEPNVRDRASFIPEINELIGKASLEIVKTEAGGVGPLGWAVSETLGPGYRLHVSQGHTPGLLLSEFETGVGPVVVAADLVPGAAWVHLPITMGYDRFPERLIEEKTALFEDLVRRGGTLFFTHDPVAPWGRLECEAGRYRVAEEREAVLWRGA